MAMIHRYASGALDLYSAIFVPDALPWFAVGAIFFDLHKGRLNRTAALMFLAPMFMLIIKGAVALSDKHYLPYDCAVSFTFFSIFWLVSTGHFSANRFLVWIGERSYSKC
jgi:peptidoglycan/LPS O-acetylase OafA/YrhL